VVRRAQRLVDGLVLPVTLARHPVLEFCNTRAGWGAEIAREYLVDYHHLVVWARSVELVTPASARRLHRAVARDPRGAAHVLTRALRLARRSCSCTDADSASAWDGVAAAAISSPPPAHAITR
jgi:hypothetical protein